jgi:hypothetical protein
VGSYFLFLSINFVDEMEEDAHQYDPMLQFQNPEGNARTQRTDLLLIQTLQALTLEIKSMKGDIKSMGEMREPKKETGKVPFLKAGGEIDPVDNPELAAVAECVFKEKEEMVSKFKEEGMNDLEAHMAYMRVQDPTPRDEQGNVLSIKTDIKPEPIPKMEGFPEGAPVPAFVRYTFPPGTTLEEQIAQSQPSAELLQGWSDMEARIMKRQEDLLKEATVEMEEAPTPMKSKNATRRTKRNDGHRRRDRGALHESKN